MRADKLMVDKFASVRWCDHCKADVAVETRDKTIMFPVYGKKEPVTYKASYCSRCGTILCERDFDDALEELAKRKEEERNARKAHTEIVSSVTAQSEGSEEPAPDS